MPDTTPPIPCSWVALGQPHTPHSWEPQPGMEPVRCPGLSGQPTTVPAADPGIADPHEPAEASGCPEDCPVHNWRSPDVRHGAGYPAWARLVEAGIHTPGCDCDHDDMGPGWHANDCVWKADWKRFVAETPAPADATLRDRMARAVRQAGDGAYGSTPFYEAITTAALAVVQPALDELADCRERAEAAEAERVRLLTEFPWLRASEEDRETAEAAIARVRELADAALLYDDVPQDRLARNIPNALTPPADQPDGGVR